jgi:hypothetical protein
MNDAASKEKYNQMVLAGFGLLCSGLGVALVLIGLRVVSRPCSTFCGLPARRCADDRSTSFVDD